MILFVARSEFILIIALVYQTWIVDWSRGSSKGLINTRQKKSLFYRFITDFGALFHGFFGCSEDSWYVFTFEETGLI